MNLYVETLKNAQYKVGKDGALASAFSDVVLSGFGRDDKGAGFTITLKFDPLIFDGTQEVSLAVGDAATETRDQNEGQDSDLFQESPTGGEQ